MYTSKLKFLYVEIRCRASMINLILIMLSRIYAVTLSVTVRPFGNTHFISKQYQFYCR